MDLVGNDLQELLERAPSKEDKLFIKLVAKLAKDSKLDVVVIACDCGDSVKMGGSFAGSGPQSDMSEVIRSVVRIILFMLRERPDVLQKVLDLAREELACTPTTH